ncbi:MAG: BrnT family toxin [Pseudomonadota bacterium]
MKFEWHSTKARINLQKHHVAFSLMEELDWETAVTVEDSRADYGEMRFVTLGLIHQRLYVAVWTPREEAIRLIFLRKANDRERNLYDEALKN